MPVEQASGIQWNIAKDYFYFKIKFNRRNLTEGNIVHNQLHLWSMGFISPFVVKVRQLLQHLYNQNVQQNKTDNEELRYGKVLSQWIKWDMKLNQVENLHIPRSLQPPSFRRITDTSILHLSDASEHGYGQCSCMRSVDKDGLIHCSLLLRKSRVSPKKFISIPRLELTATVLSVKVACLLRKELQIDSLKLTDGQVVLAYIRSNCKQFKEFVVNHIHQIKKNTRVHQ